MIQVLVGTGRAAMALSDGEDTPPGGPDTVPLPTGGPA